MSRPRRLDAVAAALAVGLLATALAACGGGGSKNPTPTKAATKAATTVTPRLTGTPTAALTPTPPAATEQGPPSATPAGTEAPGSEATNTPPSTAEAAVGVSLREFSLALSRPTALAGPVTFDVTNDGTIPHDFWVIRSELAADGLPVNQTTYMVDESQVNVIRKQPPIHQEDSATVAVDLPAGRYVLICNIADHYQTGMRIAFTVQ